MDESQIMKIIIKRRREIGMMQKTLAREIGISRSSIANTENGHQKLYMCRFFKICEVLDLKLSDFEGVLNK